MPNGRSSSTRRPVKVRRTAGGRPRRPAAKRPAGSVRKLCLLLALALLLLALGIWLMVCAFRLPRQEETPAPSQYRQEMSIAPKESASPRPY